MPTDAAGRLRLLILGGTGEAYDLADRIEATLSDRVTVVTSLAGRTGDPRQPAGQLRVGGFGGTAGLVAWMKDTGIGCLVDATHPFAEQMTGQAYAACEDLAMLYLRLERPAWVARDGDNWHPVDDATAAAALLPQVGTVAFLTVGTKELAAFGGLDGVRFAMRVVDPPAEPAPLEDVVLILGRGPFDLEDERALLAKHRIDVLVTRNSGGAATEAKLTAAREAGIPVIMIERPARRMNPAVKDVAAALDWLQERI